MEFLLSDLQGSRLSLARLLSMVENDHPQAAQILDEVFRKSGKAHRVGITGAPGTGKSTLTARLALSLRACQKTVAILAVDPSSPFSGGALLGDRIRMKVCSGDPGIFIRSMASRGAAGGLSLASAGAADIFDAAGFDYILIETVGAGQAEVAVAGLAHSVVVVEAPGLGDEVQAIKAGILEIADLIVVNKADLPGALQTEKALMAAFHGAERSAFRHHSDIAPSGSIPDQQKDGGWQIPILRTNAINNEGIDDLRELLFRHYAFLQTDDRWQKREQERIRQHWEQLLRQRLYDAWRKTQTPEDYQELLQRLYQHEDSPLSLLKNLLPD